jgi:hypothetical protein
MFNSLNTELNSICHLLALLEAHHILHVNRIKVNAVLTFLHIILGVVLSLILEADIKKWKHHTHISES